MKAYFNIKHLFVMLAALGFMMMTAGSSCSAEEFSQIYTTGRISLKENKALTETFQTAFGDMTLKFRRMFGTSSKKRFHFVIELGEKNRVADQYFPSLKSGYTIKAFRDKSNDRVFFSVQTKYQSWLLGYDEKIKQVRIFVDSKKYWTPEQGRPEFVVRGNRIHLMYTYQEDKKYKHLDYELYWDEDAKWFGYIDKNEKASVDEEADAIDESIECEQRIVYEEIYMPEPVEEYDEVIITTR